MRMCTYTRAHLQTSLQLQLDALRTARHARCVTLGMPSFKGSCAMYMAHALEYLMRQVHPSLCKYFLPVLHCKYWKHKLQFDT